MRITRKTTTHGLALIGSLALLAGCAEMQGDTGGPAAESAQQAAGTATTPDAAAAQAAGAGDAAMADAAPGWMADIGGQTDWQGQLSAAALDLTVAARDARGWDILWQLVGEAAPMPLPDSAMAVAVFAGARPTSGYDVAIRTIVEDGQGLTVLWAETQPAADAILAPQVTAPLRHQADPPLRRTDSI